ncbi:hypothetical protein I4U23_005414 [Adineta vaga]|nr:hypothetical protein I4U23_005414 [Adineta vaga]
MPSTTQIVVPSSCSIPATNAEWNQESTILVNPIGQCLSNDYGLCGARDFFIDNIHDNLYVVDTGNNRIQKYSLTEPFDPQQGAIGITVASKGLIQPESIFVDSQTEDMYILDHKTKIIDSSYDPAYRVQLWKKNDETGKLLLGEVAEYRYGAHSHLTLDKEMNIYVATRYYIRKWLSSTNYTRRVIVAGKSEQSAYGASDLWDPSYFGFDNNLTLYIADWQNRRIQKWLFNANEGITITSNPTYVYGLAIDCNGYLYYNNELDRSIYQVNSINNTKTIVIGDESRFHKIKPTGTSVLTFDKFGNIFAIDMPRVVVRKFSLL